MSENRRRPDNSEYADDYAAYVDCVPDADVLETLKAQIEAVSGLVAELGPEKSAYRYAPDKWTASQVLGHIIDTEWIFVNRVLRFARGDTTPLPGVDQDVLARDENFEGRTLESLGAEFRQLRGASLLFFQNLDDAALGRRGNASGCEFTVRALLWIIAGHARHHLGVLRERYSRDIS